jgi:DNA modification methylase
MTVQILVGDILDRLADIPDESVDCIVTSPPYWGLRDYEVDGQIGMETSLGEHLDVMVGVFDAIRRVMKKDATLWLNYGDCYATTRNGRSAAEAKALGLDDRTHRDKPFSTIGPIYVHDPRDRTGKSSGLEGGKPHPTAGRIIAGGTLKPKDLCMVANRLAIALQDAGWWVRSEIIWGKPNPKPDSSGRFRPSGAHEKIFLLTKTGNSFYDSKAVRMPASPASIKRWSKDVDAQRGSFRDPGKTNGAMKAVGSRGIDRLLRNYEPDLSAIVPVEVWDIPTASFSDAHFATFPPALVVPCLLAGCRPGGTVLDPFGGAGTTALVADRMGLDAILIELKPEYAEIARSRIETDARMFGKITTHSREPIAPSSSGEDMPLFK